MEDPCCTVIGIPQYPTVCCSPSHLELVAVLILPMAAHMGIQTHRRVARQPQTPDLPIFLRKQPYSCALKEPGRDLLPLILSVPGYFWSSDRVEVAVRKLHSSSFSSFLPHFAVFWALVSPVRAAQSPGACWLALQTAVLCETSYPKSFCMAPEAVYCCKIET